MAHILEEMHVVLKAETAYFLALLFSPVENPSGGAG